MLTRLLVMSIEVSSVLGCSINRTILLNEGFFLFLRMFTSLLDKEKKATSLPAIKNESRKRITSKKTNTVDATGDTVKKKKENESNTE